MKITSKGQVTIPLPIRSEFGLKPGTDVEFVAEAGKVILRAKRRRLDPVEAWLEESTGVSRGRTTTAKLMKLTRGED
jgi:AbrB family looped-hinge helix DNA binding protein